jgi:hypothetical protein
MEVTQIAKNKFNENRKFVDRFMATTAAMLTSQARSISDPEKSRPD